MFRRKRQWVSDAGLGRRVNYGSQRRLGFYLPYEALTDDLAVLLGYVHGFEPFKERLFVDQPMTHPSSR